jgi:hypothetical protein
MILKAFGTFPDVYFSMIFPTLHFENIQKDSVEIQVKGKKLK